MKNTKDPSKDLERLQRKLLDENEKMKEQFIFQFIKDQVSGKFKPKIQEKLFQDNSRYLGELLEGKRANKGIYYYKNGDIYFGDWKDDKFHGKGVYIFAKGERYEGELANGFKTGNGDYQYLNGNFYQGQWREDKKQGFGVYTYLLTGEKYEGEWDKGLKHGKGTFLFSYGDKYEGGFAKGLTHLSLSTIFPEPCIISFFHSPS